MQTLTPVKRLTELYSLLHAKPVKTERIVSIDLLRGIVMVIMALDHVRSYFHHDAFLYSPTDLSQTNVFLFFTRFVTHYCAPVFVFLAGVSAYLSGRGKTKNAVARFLFLRGLWLVFAELIIVSLGWTFNPAYPLLNLQVIWAIGISMMVLSGLIFIKRRVILAVAIGCIAGHNLLDWVHVAGDGLPSFIWSALHEAKDFHIGRFTVFVHYPVIPWIGIMALGFFMGHVYRQEFDAVRRRQVLLRTGLSALAVFIILRGFTGYGESLPWAGEKNELFGFLSFINVSKYPPSLLYSLITLGPALIFLSLMEKPMNALSKKLTVFGRVPFFYYVVHIYLIHFLALIAAAITGYGDAAMILTTRVNKSKELEGYGVDLLFVYTVWVLVVLLLYPACRWFAGYKRRNQAIMWWLQYV